MREISGEHSRKKIRPARNMTRSSSSSSSSFVDEEELYEKNVRAFEGKEKLDTLIVAKKEMIKVTSIEEINEYKKNLKKQGELKKKQ